jgi:TolB-like protein
MNRSHPYSQVLRRVLPAILVILGTTGGISGQVPQADRNMVSLFVLDFDNRYGDPRLEWLTQALKDMVLLRMEEERRIIGRDAGDVTPFLDSRMGERAGETTRLASNNLVLMGAYWREDARLVVDLQLLDMRNWSSLGRGTVEALYSDVPQLNQSLAAKVRELVRGVEFFSGIDVDAAIVKKKPQAVIPEFDERPAYTPPDEDYQQQILSHQEDLARALDDLEEAMDVYSGYTQEPSGTQQTGEAYYRDFSLEGMGALPVEKARHTALFEDILQRVARNPYSAEIGDLDLAVDPYEDNRIFISIPVAYTVKQDLLEEMLYSLPYVSTREERNLRMLRYDKSKFNFTNNR